MITIYPMLYTSGVSESALPGICTVLEAYLLTYHQQEILTNPSLINNPNRRVNFKVDSRGRITGRVRESYVLEADPNDPNDPDVYNAGNKPGQPQIITPRQQSQQEKDLADRLQVTSQDYHQAMEDTRAAREEAERHRDEIERMREEEREGRRMVDLKGQENKLRDLQSSLNIEEDKLKTSEMQREKTRKEIENIDREYRRHGREASAKSELEASKLQLQMDKDERELELTPLKKRKELADTQMKELELKEKQKELIEDKMKKASVKIESINSKTISLEPSTVMVALEMPNKVTKRELVGVKVVPMKVKSDVKMAYLLTSDAQLSFIMRLVTVAGRGILKKAWSIFDKMLRAISIGPFKEYGGVTVTGDPRKDIILGRTGHQGETFVAIEKSTDFDEFILADPVKIKKLFQLGWGNLIITDNVTKQAHFCMKKYRGICNTIPYVMLYESLKMSKSYETLEDIKKQTQSLFKAKPIRIEKVLSEILAVSKLRQYKSLREGK
jgi:hypothetical protein